MAAAFVLVLVLVLAAAGVLAYDVRALGRKLRAEQLRADAAAAAVRHARAAKDLADDRRDRAVLGYGGLLAEIETLAVHYQNNRQTLIARQLRRLVDDRLGTLRRL